MGCRSVIVAAALAISVGCTSGTTSSTERPSIEHVVIVVKENHSFDNYFGSRDRPPSSLAHCQSAVFQNRCQYNSTDIPAYYQYARGFGYADNYFSDVRGPSWPNHMMMIAGQSPLYTDPPLPVSTWICPFRCYHFPTIGDRLSDASVTWRNYGEELYDPFRSIDRFADDSLHNVDVPQFFSDLSSGNFPSVAWVRPSFPESEHPGYDVAAGEDWTVGVVNAVMRSQFWSSTAILITWDDAGTVPDHVAPPVVELTGSGKPLRYGYRVPLLVISPFTRAGMVSHEVLSHVSLLRFIEDLFHLESLTFRDRDANGLGAFFDFSTPSRSPLVLSD